MDLENRKSEEDFLVAEKKSENEKNERHFNNVESLNKIRNEVIGNSSIEQNRSNNFESNSSNTNDSITLTLDALTTKNMKFMATVIKVFSVLGIIVGVFQIFAFFIGILTIIISLKFLKSANALEEALLMKDENKLKQYFNEQSKALKLYIIFIIVSIVIGIVVYGFMIAALISGVLNSSSYYNSY